MYNYVNLKSHLFLHKYRLKKLCILHKITLPDTCFFQKYYLFFAFLICGKEI